MQVFPAFAPLLPFGEIMIKLIAAIFLVPIILVLCVFAYSEVSKSYWDKRVQEMCAEDGGIRVFEAGTVSKQQWDLLLNPFGQLSPPLENRASDDVTIAHKNTSTYIRRNNPEVRRDELVVIRNGDKKVLGVTVSYSRVGGDVIALHPSYFSCPENAVDVFSAVIAQVTQKK